MRTGRKALRFLAISGAVLASVYIISMVWEGEPRFGGRKLSFWLSRIDSRAISDAERAEATNAVVTIGTNNVDLLLKWFREPEPPDREPWTWRVKTWLGPRLYPVKFSREFGLEFHPSRPGMAYLVFHDFPEVARERVPAFTNFLCDPDVATKGKSAMVLNAIGAKAIPMVAPILSCDNPTNRSLAIFIISNAGTEAMPFVVRFRALLEDPSPYPRIAAADALLRLRSDPQPAISALVRCAKEGDEHARACAWEAIGKATNCPDLAVPALLDLLDATTNRPERFGIYNALNALSPEAAARVRTDVLGPTRETERDRGTRH